MVSSISFFVIYLHGGAPAYDDREIDEPTITVSKMIIIVIIIAFMISTKLVLVSPTASKPPDDGPKPI